MIDTSKSIRKVTYEGVDIPLSPQNPIIATTDEEMTNLLVESNTGKVVKFTGTAGTYETDTLYLIEGV